MELRFAFGYLLILLEILWIIGWVISMGFAQAMATEHFRIAHFFLVHHTAFIGITLFAIYESVMKQTSTRKSEYNLHWVFGFVIILGIATDVNSLLETLLHLPSTHAFYTAMLVLTISGLVIAGSTLLWFLFGIVLYEKKPRNYNKL